MQLHSIIIIFDPLHWPNVITFTGFRITWPRQWLLILCNKGDAAMSHFSQSESLTHILTEPNVMEMSSALVSPYISLHYIYITYATSDFNCNYNYICHNLSGFITWLWLWYGLYINWWAHSNPVICKSAKGICNSFLFHTFRTTVNIVITFGCKHGME